MDIVYRLDPSRPFSRPLPADAASAREALERGNREFARLVASVAAEHPGTSPLSTIIPLDPRELGLPTGDGRPPRQEPFAAVLSCADARVPIELLFEQGCNDLFVVRVAGNVLGDSCLGSVDYAVRHLHGSLRILVVLGHSGCGAITAAVDAYLRPRDYEDIAFSHTLRSIVDRLFVSVRGAAKALKIAHGPAVEERPGHREALIETAIAVNAALASHHLRREMRALGVPALPVYWGVYDLVSHLVRSPGGSPDAPTFDAGLREAPETSPDLVSAVGVVARAEPVRRLLL